ncbi:MAG: LuxR C-terminal-related transcriptional regulator [Burkholderiales bacterium]|nr:LuxR C-terminal-related transcriptional regulator [Burkholderiales bacterium]
MAASLWKNQGPPPIIGTASPIIADLLLRAADGVFAVDANQRITFWNPASERFLGISASQALGHPCYRLIQGCDIKGRPVCGPVCQIARLAKGGAAPATFELAINNKHDHPQPVGVSTVLAPSPRDGLWTVIHVLRRGHAIEQRPAQPGHGKSAKSNAIVTPARSYPLTAREQKILQLLAEGFSAVTISRDLCISRATVRNHIQHILNKLGLHSKLEAVAYAYRRHLIKLPSNTLSTKGDSDAEENCGAGQG